MLRRLLAPAALALFAGITVFNAAPAHAVQLTKVVSLFGLPGGPITGTITYETGIGTPAPLTPPGDALVVTIGSVTFDLDVDFGTIFYTLAGPTVTDLDGTLLDTGGGGTLNFATTGVVTFTPAGQDPQTGIYAVPEPATASIFLAGLLVLGLAFCFHRKQRSGVEISI